MKLNLSNNKNNETKNVQTAQVNNNSNDAVMHEVDVIGLMTSLKQNGKAKLSDHFKDAEVVEPVSEEPKADAKPVTLKRKAASEREQNGTRSSSAEREQARQKVKVTLRKKQAAEPRYSITEYTTKKGGTAYLLFGFESKEAAEMLAEKCSKTISASWRTGENGEKRYCLSMGTRYGDVARTLCDALNNDDAKAIAKAAKDSCKVYDKAVADGKAAREQKKQERAEAKAEKKSLSPDPSPSSEGSAKTYTAEDVDKAVADALKKVLAGGVLPENVKKLMAA